MKLKVPFLMFQSSITLNSNCHLKAFSQPNQPDHPGTGIKPQLGGHGREPKKTRDGTPEPRAKAREAHEPEPLPQKAREEEAEGSKPAGQGDEGKQTHKPSAVATALTTATDRAAKAPGPEPKEEACNTVADGKEDRKNSSTPGAQPTNTAADLETRDTTREAAPKGTDEREPEKPKAENLEKIVGSDIKLT